MRGFLIKLIILLFFFFLSNLLLASETSAQSSSEFFAVNQFFGGGPQCYANSICGFNSGAGQDKDCNPVGFLCGINPFCDKFTGNECCALKRFDFCQPAKSTPNVCLAVPQWPFDGFHCSFNPTPIPTPTPTPTPRNLVLDFSLKLDKITL